MEILWQGRVVGELTSTYPGKLVDPGPELRRVTSRTYTVFTGGSCCQGGATVESLPFEQLGIGDQVRELRLAGFALRLSSGEVLSPPKSEPMTIYLKLGPSHPHQRSNRAE
jgi:hypothetical protein